MAIDVRQLRPSMLTRMLNSTPLGEVLGDRQLRRHRNRAGYRIGDEKHVDLLRYAAWLLWNRHNPEPEREPRDYEAMKEAARARNAELSAIGRDIGEIPEVIDPDRKAKAATDFRFFCEAYFPETFSLPWSDDHLKVIAKIETAVLRGGLFAMAMPRGSGKTTLAETACIWAMLTGAQEFVCLIGSDAGHARSMLESIKVEFETNERLLDDYPEAVFPIHALERIHNRAKGQLCGGKATRIVWTADEIVLPTIADSKASGAIIRVAGIESRIRGMKFKRADGRAVRPSLVVLDDPQTDESARSDMQVRARMETLNGAILNLAGPGQKISGIMPCTVIRPGDMADQILDRDKHPAWQGERTRLVYVFPTNEKLWDKYAQIRADSFRNDGDGHEATEFYGKHRKEMDAGAVIAWPERHNEDELSAIQHAMNLRLQDERAFWAEYQNQPLPQEEGESDQLNADAIAAKTNGLPRGVVPIGASHLTMFIDVQGKLLFHAVVAWEDDFTGYVVDYGTYPDQQRPVFALREVQKTLARVAPGTGMEGSIYAGLEKLTDAYLAKRWRRDDGAEMGIERCLIDANWGQSTDVVYQFCRQSAHAGLIMPSHGRYVGASSVPFSEYKRKKGERVGLHWRVPTVQGRRQVRHVLIDTNYWKSFVHARLAVAMGDPGSLSLFGRKPSEHQLLAEHLTAEYRVKTEARGRIVDEWKIRAGGPDNHWLDCMVGCAVAASILGAVLPGTDAKAATARAPIRLSELRKGKR
ncbi:MAG: phage terminase large subunit family protein [Verrucomicrobia bacterium]|nr:phage terminase large subunit family protein [Verrucomicrobiota bacterium]HQF60124.1 phage terminase large subunit family protein [Verrucomicrobiota bacterium]